MIKSFEGLRGMAALIVALYHLKIGAEYFSLIRNGYLLVDLFFVLSGFVISAAYWIRLQNAHDFRVFLIRRIGRLLPLLIFSTAIFILAANLIVLVKQFALMHGYGDQLGNPAALDYLMPSASELLATVTLTHSLGIFDRLILNTPSWSISTEFYAYVVFGLLCVCLRGKNRIAALTGLGLIALAIAVWAGVAVHDCLRQGECLSLTYDFGFARCLFSFCLGVMVFHVARYRQFNAEALQISAVIMLVILFSLVDKIPLMGFLFPIGFALLVLSISSDQGLLSRLLIRRPFQVLGQRSYSIYLLHLPLLLFFDVVAKRIDGIFPSLVLLLVFSAVLVMISGWSYKLIEDPFRIAFNRMSAGEGIFDVKRVFSVRRENSKLH